MEEIINKVALSGLVSIDLEEWIPEGVRKEVDLAGQLWQGLALREKDFREWVKEHDWQQYRDTYVAVYCSADAIVPHWAYMLVASRLSGVARQVVCGTPAQLEARLLADRIATVDVGPFRDARVVVKGCSDREVSVAAYVDLVARLQPVVRSILFGEPCSTVPVYKRAAEARD